MTTRRTSRWSGRCLLWLAALCVVACANLVPRQGWDSSAGPVVPHDSFPADCSLCHTGSDWHTLRADFTFDHEARTGVPLHGAHADAACLLCHNDRGPVQQFAARGCGGCHGDPHQARLGAACDDCHDDRTWVPREAIARHDRTRFPLVGAHVAAACFRCHPGAQVGNFAGASPVCVHCHGADFTRATNPNHVQLGLPQQCDSCHTPVGWQPARFDHPPSFPLTLGHAGRACADCHSAGGSFGGLSRDCAACHSDDFAATTAPNHAATGFPMACATCHGTAAWQPSTWSHPSPIDRGDHSGLGCADCHTVASSFAMFSCTHCHDHRQSEMADEHGGVPGYSWVSAACYQCHPTGRR
jgi:hypothetical protein